MSMYVGAAGATGAAGADLQVKRGNELGKQEFLMLLVEQLRNQDPMNPVSDSAFIAQLAQFSGLEATQGMARTLDETRAAAMIGKQVTVATADGTMEGLVGSVRLDGERVVLIVDGLPVDLSNVVEVKA